MLAPQATATSVLPVAPSRSTHALRAGDGERAGRLEDRARVLEHVLDRGADLVGVDQHHLVDQLLAQAEGLARPTCFTATPSANRPTCSSATRRPAASERAMASASTGSTPMIFTAGPQALDVRGDAGDQAAAADRDEDRVDRPRGAGAGSPCRWCPARRSRPDRRRDGRTSARASSSSAQRVAVGLVVGFAGAAPPRRRAPHRVDLDLRRGHRHHDHRAAAELLRRERHALRVVAGRGGDHAALQRLRRQRAPSCCRRRAA